MNLRQKSKPKQKQKLDDFLLMIKGNPHSNRIVISLDFKSEGLTTEYLNAYLLATVEAVERFRKNMCSESSEDWMKKNFPHYAREIERRKTSSYVA